MIVDVTDRGSVTRFTIDRDSRHIGSDDTTFASDTIPDTVTELLDTQELIGPQVDEFTGAIGSWDHPINVVAASTRRAQARTGTRPSRCRASR